MSAFTSRLLRSTDRIDAFECGRPTLDAWLIEQARRAQDSGTARTYVWVRRGEERVAAYFAIAPTQVLRTELPGGGLAGGYSVIPAYLLARLAVDLAEQGRGLGRQVLVDALGRIVEAAAVGGGRLIVVDAMDDRAHEFYRLHDFIPVTGSARLYMKISTARAAIGRLGERA